MNSRQIRWLAVLACLVGGLTAATAQELVPDRSSAISLRSQTIDIRVPLDIPAELKAAAAPDGAGDYVLIKFPGPVSDDQIRALRKRAKKVYTYLPNDAFLVRLPAGSELKAHDAELGAIWTGTYHPAYKISPAVAAVTVSPPLESPQGDTADATKATVGPAIQAVEEPLIVLVHLFPDADVDAVAASIEARWGEEIVGRGQRERFSRLRMLLTPSQIVAMREHLARRNEVFWLDLEARRVLLNDTTIWVAQTGTSGGQQTPVYDQGIFGEGQIVGVLDTGVDADMCYFRDGVLGLPPQNPCNGGTLVDTNQRKVIAVDFLWGNECNGGIGINEWDTNDHGTHVAGTAVGDNLANPLTHDPGDGIAPGAQLVMQDCGFQTDNCADCPGIGNCPIVDLNPVFQQAFNQGARIHTNSWGDDENNPVKGLYSAGSEDADEFMWNNKNFLLLFANGNDGPGTNTVGSPATAKNVIGVGATLRGASADSMANFSSCGPTDDGRVKPDITMPGSSIQSANADNNVTTNNCNTTSLSGTSMASPGAAGTAALIRQYYTDGWYPSGAANAGDAFTPSAALLKATMINSATDMTNVAAIPSNCQGWGRVRLDDSLHFAGETRGLFAEDDTTGFPQGSSGATRTFNFTVASSSEPFKVTLTWTDFPSTPAAGTNIVNDLDVTVTGPSGTFRGNVFSGGQSTTGGNADRINTVEQVLLASPATGNYTVTVSSFTVPQGPQPFALAVTGDFASSCSVDADCDNGLFCDGAETCGAGGLCEAGTPPCSGAESCLEDTDACVVCLHDVDFESGAGGWAQGADSCSTGSFIVGTPDATDWQPGSGNPGQAFFTANNPGGIGTDDVDGGTCEALSPTVNAAGNSEVLVSLDYFHGQRDPGDDAGDGFTIEVLNNGTVVNTLVSIGDVTNTASWTSVSTTVANPGNIQLRVRATDAAAGGDIVEGGVDNVLVCPTGTPTGCTVDADCDNSLFCDGAETCNTGTGLCESGTPPVCDDGVACTVDSCNEATDSCDAAPDNSACDNGLFCDGAETCSATLGCQAGTAPNCNDGVGCTADSCNEATDSCDNTPNDAVCDNGLFCDGSEVCNATLDCQDAPDPCSGSQTCNETTDVCEGGGGCSHSTGFESGADGWTNGADTCTTGAFIVGTPDATTWQLGSGNPGQAFFTANNPGGIGGDDVDGGTCEALSPVVDCGGQASADISIDYYHGQRDNADGAGDGFVIEVLNNGAVVDTLVAIGDVTNNPAWTNVSTNVANPGDIQIRVRATDDAGGGDIVEGGIDNVSISAGGAPPPPPTCSVNEGFEGGLNGWANSGSCSTGAYVTGSPTEQVNGGVTTQVGGPNSGAAAAFTATNTTAGSNDVDGGTCILTSPNFPITSGQTLDVAYFHGQRDAGDDPGDGFELEYSTDGGSTWNTLASNGDTTSNAAWTNAPSTVLNASTVQLRVQCSDATGGGGDLVECGIDDVTVCTP